MSKNGFEWLIAIALVVGFIGYCNLSDRQRQSPGGFDKFLIGSWSDAEMFTMDDGRVVDMRLRVDFASDHTFHLTMHDQAVDPVAFEGTWSLRNDPNLKSPTTSRILVLKAIEPIGGEYLVVFAGQEIVSQLMPRMTGEMRRWKRVR